ncbi:MAG: aminotransferase class V-fold PLP-dependent enzyme [Phycisphaerales bacterium]|nr:MAG: aminotransferase class V-fold PLP-dependent enzyme [Phycisphaerales bacterium]
MSTSHTTTASGTDREQILPTAIRAHFPALKRDLVYFENAGGSQVPTTVADRMREYMLNSYVQLGAGYDLSTRCTEVVEEAHRFINRFMGGESAGRVILGASCTQLCNMLADCYAPTLMAGDEIILCETGHEANLGAWERLADRVDGLRIRWWKVDPKTGECSLDDLKSLLSDRTRLLAFPHVSNLLGEIVDIDAITRLAHDAGARVVVDGVAYAPHRAMNVSDWNVDWYVYSTYKVYGPHMGALFGRSDAIAELKGPNHFFILDDDVPYKFEPGGVSHEGCAGLLGFGEYLRTLTGATGDGLPDRAAIESAGRIMTRAELPLQERLVGYLNQHPNVRLVGPAHGGESRVGTISFLHTTKSSAEITRAIQHAGFAMRHGHMYAYRMCQAMGIDLQDGVVRISFVHYNTLDEIERLINALEAIL